MSLFGKLKENVNHDGVKIQLQAPASASMTNPTVPVSITIFSSGEPKDVSINLVMNQGAALEAQLLEGIGMAQVAGALQKLQTVSEALNGDSYQYFIEASTKIQGVTFSPRSEQQIQVLKPGQMGGGFNIKAPV